LTIKFIADNHMNNKIGFKLIFAVGITAIIIIGVYSYINLVSQSDVLFSEVERHAIQQSEIVKSVTRYDMLLNHRERIHKIINTIGDQPCINRVRILNKEGVIIYSSRSNDIGKMVDKDAESCYVCHAEDKPLQRLPTEDRTRVFRMHPDSDRVLGVINPVYNEEACWNANCHAHSQEQTVLGVLDVTMCLTDVDAQIRASKIKVIAFAIISIVAISMIIGIFVRKWIDIPVNELVKATQQVASGNLEYTIHNISKDELGELERSFNIMTQKLTEARMQLFQSDKMASLGRLAAGVAHEINNPLTGVLTYSSFLLRKAENNPELHADLKVIVREAKRSREIVKSLLDFARQSMPKRERADLSVIIRRALSVMENQLTLNKIKIEQTLDETLPEIIVDANQMQQVIINLLVNAADAIGPHGGKIKIVSSVLSLSPKGMIQIKNAICSKNHNLVDNDFKIGGLPSIKLKVKTDGREGFINIDPIYGNHRNHYALPYSKDHLVELYCPECHVSLIEEDKSCPECSSPIYALSIPSQGKLEGCTKFGCYWQRWDVVDLKGDKQYVEVIISDTGCGISNEDLPKIFEPFYSTKDQSGTGLGLAVSWGIINNHGGTIGVDSELGKGTTFKIRIPV